MCCQSSNCDHSILRSPWNNIIRVIIKVNAQRVHVLTVCLFCSCSSTMIRYHLFIYYSVFASSSWQSKILHYVGVYYQLLLDSKIDRVDLNDRSMGNSVQLNQPPRLWGILSMQIDSGQQWSTWSTRLSLTHLSLATWVTSILALQCRISCINWSMYAYFRDFVLF